MQQAEINWRIPHVVSGRAERFYLRILSFNIQCSVSSQNLEFLSEMALAFPGSELYLWNTCGWQLMETLLWGIYIHFSVYMTCWTKFLAHSGTFNPLEFGISFEKGLLKILYECIGHQRGFHYGNAIKKCFIYLWRSKTSIQWPPFGYYTLCIFRTTASTQAHLSASNSVPEICRNCMK